MDMLNSINIVFYGLQYERKSFSTKKDDILSSSILLFITDNKVIN